jgi:lipoprotein-releasing system ATP-binding protein
VIHAIEIHKTFRTPQNLHVLKGINLEVRPAELLCIIGASGVGKSTLLHILGTLDRPTQGTLLFSGRNIFELNDQELADFRNNSIGFVFQFHHLLPEFTALENVMMPALIKGMSSREAGERALKLLSEVGLVERKAHRPGELSGGEQQRVAVARALVLEPRLILADEPTGNLDTQTGDDVFSTMRELNRKRGTTFILVTHNERLSSQADRIVRMVDGRMEAVGSTPQAIRPES